jgi:hypothetical protein
LMPKAREHKGISPFSDIRTVPDHARKDFFSLYKNSELFGDFSLSIMGETYGRFKKSIRCCCNRIRFPEGVSHSGIPAVLFKCSLSSRIFSIEARNPRYRCRDGIIKFTCIAEIPRCAYDPAGHF